MRYRINTIHYINYITFKNNITSNNEDVHLNIQYDVTNKLLELLYKRLTDLNIKYKIVDSPVFEIPNPNTNSYYTYTLYQVTTQGKNTIVDDINDIVVESFINENVNNFIQSIIDTSNTIHIYTVSYSEYTHTHSSHTLEPIVLGPDETYKKSMIFKIRSIEI